LDYKVYKIRLKECEKMNMHEHIVTVDRQGCFYCRAVDSNLNYNNDEYVCGRGCPCYVECGNGRFVCRYADTDNVFPRVEGLDLRLQKAYEYAANAHKGQFRKGTNIPYFSHIITTMNYAFGLTDDMEILQAAILHDTMEDTAVTYEDLEREFGTRVAKLVEQETENKRTDLPPDETWELRKKEGIEHVREGSHDIKLIVLADKTANLESVVREWRIVGDKIWSKFNQHDKRKHEWYFRSMREQLSEFEGSEAIRNFDAFLLELFG
jgi:myo-inositol-1(or 4)-monophosphatase